MILSLDTTSSSSLCLTGTLRCLSCLVNVSVFGPFAWFDSGCSVFVSLWRLSPRGFGKCFLILELTRFDSGHNIRTWKSGDLRRATCIWPSCSVWCRLKCRNLDSLGDDSRREFPCSVVRQQSIRQFPRFSDNFCGFPREGGPRILVFTRGNLDVLRASCLRRLLGRWIFLRVGGLLILRSILAVFTTRVRSDFSGALYMGTGPGRSCPQGHGLP